MAWSSLVVVLRAQSVPCLQVDDVDDEESNNVQLAADGNSLVIRNQTCRRGDCIYLAPTTFDQAATVAQDASAAQVPDYAAKGRYHKGGGNAGLRAWCIARMSQLTSSKANGKQAKQVNRFISRCRQIVLW